jgi:CRISPR-associated protein Cmr5
MSKKNIEKYIADAIKVLDNEFKDDDVPSSYNGYISSFGASVIQSGLKPTLALFENKNANSKEKKEKLPSLILQVLDPSSKEDSLLRYVLQHEKQGKDEAYIKQQILDISVAIKLGIRTFKLDDKGQQDE